uniref:PNPLA domain-containing protein n=1 Tax=viral metagenome TaxID=1070528 RepID=A0A6C0BRS0_9ZZZZ
MSFKHIVLGSGGLGLFIQQGIIGELVKKCIINIKDITSIYTCSCGSITGTILTLGYEPEVISDYLIKRPWGRHLPQINPFTLFDQSPPKGLYDRSLFTIILEPLLDVKGISIDVTLKEMYDLTGIKVVYMTTNVNDDVMREYKLSYETHPEWKVIDAIHASCAITPLISPLEIDGQCYIDGGTICHFPYNNCMRDEKCDKSEVFCIYTKMTENAVVMPSDNILQLINAIVVKSWITLNKETNNIIQENENMISIDLGKEGEFSRIQDVLNTETARDFLFKRGTEYALTYISSRNR